MADQFDRFAIFNKNGTNGSGFINRSGHHLHGFNNAEHHQRKQFGQQWRMQVVWSRRRVKVPTIGEFTVCTFRNIWLVFVSLSAAGAVAGTGAVTTVGAGYWGCCKCGSCASRLIRTDSSPSLLSSFIFDCSSSSISFFTLRYPSGLQ